MGKVSSELSDKICQDQFFIKARSLISRTYTLSNDGLDPIIKSLDELYDTRDKMLPHDAYYRPRYYILKLRRDIDSILKRDSCNEKCKFCYANECVSCPYGLVMEDPYDDNYGRCICYMNLTYSFPSKYDM